MKSTREPARGIYQHYKGAFYEVLGIADEPEAGQRYVVYRSLGLSENLLGDPDPAGPHLGHRVVANGTEGALAVCSIPRFSELVDGKDYSGGKQVPRFRPVSDRPAS